MAMGLYWGTASLTLEEPSTWDARRVVAKDQMRADSGQSETSVRERFDRVRFSVENFATQAWRDALEAWWSYAQGGGSWGLAFDSADKVDTTLNASAIVGATSLTVASGTGIVAGRRYKIRDADGRYQEIVTVGGGYTPGSTTVPITSGLIYARSSGAIFRTVEYYPAMESEETEFPVVQNQGITWTLAHVAREYKS